MTRILAESKQPLDAGGSSTSPVDYLGSDPASMVALRPRNPGRQLALSGIFPRAGERGPANAIAAASLALTHYQSLSSGWSSTPEDSIRQLVNDAERSVVLDNLDPMSHHALGHAYALTGNREGMIKAFSTSLELNPNSALVAIAQAKGSLWQANPRGGNQLAGSCATPEPPGPRRLLDLPQPGSGTFRRRTI